MKRVYVEDLWPGDVVKLKIDAPEFRVVDVDGPLAKRPGDGAFPGDATFGFRITLSRGFGVFEVLIRSSDTVWRLP